MFQVQTWEQHDVDICFDLQFWPISLVISLPSNCAQFYAPPIIDKRAQMCACVQPIYVCVYVCHANQPDELHRWSHRFCSSLIWKFNSSSLNGSKQFFGCDVTLTYLFSAEVPPPTKIMFLSLYSVDLRENRSRYTKNVHERVLWNLVWAFHRQKMSPLTSPIPSFEGQKRGKSDFSLLNEQTQLQSGSNQQLPAAELFV